jgi:hypothetical protein
LLRQTGSGGAIRRSFFTFFSVLFSYFFRIRISRARFLDPTGAGVLAKTVREIGLREALSILQGELIERIVLSVRVRLPFLTSVACRATLSGARDVGIPGWRQSDTRQDPNLPGRKPVHVNGIE